MKAVVGCCLLLGAALPALAQDQADSELAPPRYTNLPPKSSTITWVAAGLMFAGIMFISFTKPKRIASH